MRTLMLAALVAVVAACAPPPSLVLATPPPCTSWGRLPLTVAIDPSARDYRFAVRHAEYSWTSALGRPAFAIEDLERADVVVQIGAVPNDIANAVMTESRCRNGRIVTELYLAPALDDLAAAAFAAHGLGHALGLAHSTNLQSVMQHQLNVGLMGPWDDEHPVPLYRVTETDADVALQLHDIPPLRPGPAVPPTAVAGFPGAGAVLDWLLSEHGLALVSMVVGWLWHRGVKDDKRRAVIAQLADEAFRAAEMVGLLEKLDGHGKYRIFMKTIVQALSAAKQPELSAAEYGMLEELAKRRAWIAKAAPLPQAKVVPMPPPLPPAG